MPYIEPKDKERLNPYIHELANQIVLIAKEKGYDGAFAGLLNYSCIRLGCQIVMLLFGKMRYWILGLTKDTYLEVADEFSRRVLSVYENQQIEKNGDVDAIEELLHRIKDGK